MKRKPTTNPQINGEPMSFVRLGSRFEGEPGYRQNSFTDSRGVSYRRLPSTWAIEGDPKTMRVVKQEARQSRLRRRAAFRSLITEG